MWVTYLCSWMTTCLGNKSSFGLPRVPVVNCYQFIYLVISVLVLRAGYGILLYQFLIIAYLFTCNVWPRNSNATEYHLQNSIFDQTSDKESMVWGLRESLGSAHYLVWKNVAGEMGRQKKYRDEKLTYESYEDGDDVYVLLSDGAPSKWYGNLLMFYIK